ncbi:MAG: DUF748 domain-containing protein [Gammaproteobacteria bacterium]|nr:DUF748 domain-containing protein [Gammaproteobacteria bacterium]
MFKKTNTTSAYSKQFWRQHKILVITTGMLVFITAVLAILPLVLKRTITNYLIEYGATNVSIHDVDFNLFTGALTIREAGYALVEENPFHCNEMSVNIEVLPLFSNRIFIHNFILDNCRVSIQKPDPGTIILNGFRIPLADESPDTVSETQPATPGKLWLAGLHRMQLSDVAITYKDSRLTTDIKIDNISLSNIAQWEPDLTGDYSIAIKVNNAPVSLTGAMRPFHATKSFNGELKISEFDFKHFAALFEQPDVAVTEGLLSTGLKLSSALNNENNYEVSAEGYIENRAFAAILNGDHLSQEKLMWNGKLRILLNKLDFYKSIYAENHLELSNLQFKAAKKPFTVKVASVIHQGQLTVEDQNEQQPNTHLAGSVIVNDLAITNDKSGLIIALAKAVEAKGFELSNNTKYLFPALVVRDARFAGKSKDTGSEKKTPEEYLLSFKDLSVLDTQIIDQRDIILTAINMADVKGQLIKDKQGQLKYIDEIRQTFATPEDLATAEPGLEQSQPESTQSESTQTATTREQNQARFKADVVETTGKNTLVFKDYSVEPFFQINLHSLLLKLVSIDNTSPENKTKISLITDIDESGKLRLEGESQLFSPQLTTKLSGKLTNLELHPFTSYTLPVTGRKIRHGLLSSDITLAINDRKLDNQLDMIIKNFTLIKDDSQLAKQFDDTMPLPMEMAIDFMEDKQGRIKLSVPVQGDLDNPEFRLMPAILTAMRKTLQFAALSYMKYTLQPWGSMIAIGELLHGQMTKITFEPIEFTPGETILTANQKQYLDKLSSLMQKTPRLELTVCGVATAQDIKPLPAKPESQRQASGQLPREAADQNALLTLAEQRADTVKDYLVKEKLIAPERIHNCTPAFKDDINAQPVVDLVL